MNDVSKWPAEARVSVVISAYAMRRWRLLLAAIESVQRQRPAAHEIVLVVDHNDELLARASSELDGVHVIPNEERKGLSGARNTGVRHARGQIIAFLDDDAEARSGWLAGLLKAFEDPAVMGAGGVAHPVWEGRPPRWLPPEFLWVVGASYRGLPLERAAIRNPIGATMAFRRKAFEQAGGFADGIGRVGRIPLGCEETEFAIRLRQIAPHSVLLHVPEAQVDHHVGADRGTFRYFATRCWGEGVSKAIVASSVGAEAGLASEREYVRRTLPSGFAEGVRAALRGDPAGLARSLAIAAGLSITTAGYLRGRLTLRGR
jgi:glucosyl-dolichyl phosphate glucuronosyltransferase